MAFLFCRLAHISDSVAGIKVYCYLLPAQAQQWREEFLKHRCALQFPDLLINAAQIHVELASAFAQKGDLESAKEHLGTFFQLWSTADEHVPLYQKAQKLSDSLGL